MKAHSIPRLVFALCLLCTACAGTQETQITPSQEMEPEVYIVGAEDILEIAVWQNADVSRTVTVRPDGNISLPLVDDIHAAGLSPEELKKKITEKLKPFMTEVPEVSVLVLEANSKRFYVQGEVRTPGIFPLRSRTTVSQAITLAGGFTEFARKNKIQVIRRWNNRPQTIPVKYKKIIKGSHQDDIPLMPGDIIVVP